MIYIASILLLVTLLLLGVIARQLRAQNLATESLLSDTRIRTRLYQDADESTTMILSRTLQNVSAGTHDPNLENDSFALKVIRELVKRKLPRSRWLEIQTNERLIHELFILLQMIKSRPQK